MNVSEQIKEIEHSINELTKIKEKGEALRRLKDNKDFKLIVLEGYFKDEAARLVLLKGDIGSEADQKFYTKAIKAIGMFNSYLSSVISLGRRAEDSLESHKEEKIRLQSEV